MREDCGQKENPAVTKELLAEILSWKAGGALDIDIIHRLRQRIVPAGYTPHTWICGTILCYTLCFSLGCVIICVSVHCTCRHSVCFMYVNSVLLYKNAGKTETLLEMLRSIMAQLHYQHKVLEYEKKGVPFSSHMYVPEVHAHVFKVCLVDNNQRRIPPEHPRASTSDDVEFFC